MHTILVPFDGSGHALKALQIGCDLADKYGGRIALFHVLATDKRAEELLQLQAAKEYGAKITDALNKAAGEPPLADVLLNAVGEKILSLGAARARKRGLDAELLGIAKGDPAENILLAAQKAGANTIVMGCRGLSDKKAATFGSVSHTVFEKAECTCISVK
ncbi:MAG: universal stress protein [Hyphomicrobiales bacterium]|nr:universal stress protein [Hyphomicrobiales bacterium]